MRNRLLILVALLAAGCATPKAAGPGAPASPARAELAIWCEFMPYADVLDTLPVLAKYRCDLLLHVGRKDVGDPDLARLCREARAQEVAVVAWFLLPYDEHLYVGEETVDATRELAMRFVAWAQREDLGVKWVVFDCEPSPLLGKELFASVRRGRVLELADILRGEKDPARFEKSVAGLNRLIEDLHGAGLRVMGAANRVFLDFMRYGNTTVQDSLNAPFSMVNWDRASFITYRYKASQVTYVAMINRYATLARRYFGDRAALDLGLLGDQRGFPEHRERAELFGGGDQFIGYLNGMRSVYDLEEVTAVALGRGVKYINLYSLDGAVDSVAGLDYWLKAASEARPAGGLTTWTPLRSLEMGLLSVTLEGLFRGMVGNSSNDCPPRPCRGEASPRSGAGKHGRADFQPLENGEPAAR